MSNEIDGTAGGAQGPSVRKRRMLKAIAIGAAVAGSVWSLPQLAGASGPGGQGLSPVVETNVAMEGPIRANVLDDARVITTHITIQPLGHTPWHSHPGPHFVSVRRGTAVVYETDCSIRGTFGIGQGFFDPGSTSPSQTQRFRDIHTLRNPSSTEVLEVVITDIREGGQPPTVVANPQPAPCFE